jgi:hypothetical protein
MVELLAGLEDEGREAVEEGVGGGRASPAKAIPAGMIETADRRAREKTDLRRTDRDRSRAEEDTDPCVAITKPPGEKLTRGNSLFHHPAHPIKRVHSPSPQKTCHGMYFWLQIKEENMTKQ